MSNFILPEEAEQAGDGSEKAGRLQSWFRRILLILIIAGLALALMWIVGRSRLFLSPEGIIKQYITALYAQDYPTAYTFISSIDKGYKSKTDFIREKFSDVGFKRTALGRLAEYIEFQSFQVEIIEDNATVTFSLELPDRNDPLVQDILFAAPRGRELPIAEQEMLLEELDQLYESGRLPTYTTEQQVELVKETIGWAVVENWAEAVRVHFSSEVKNDLPWEVDPLQEVVLARPGESLRAIYRVRNFSDQPITAKARHIDSPAGYANDLRIIQCFCLIQQTLKPNDAVEMPLIFHLDPYAVAGVKDYYILYEFYPIEDFPD